MMAALSALPWRTTSLPATIFYRSLNHVGTASKSLFRHVHTESNEDSSKQLTRNSSSSRKQRARDPLLNKGLARAWDSRQRLMSISINQHGNTPDDTFFDLCEQLRPAKHVWDTKWRQPSQSPRLTVFLLFTPGFTPWFNDNAFIPKILERLSFHTEGTGPLIFDVVYACVDGIAPHIEHGKPQEQHVNQGFSILYTHKPRSWSFRAPDNLKFADQPTITFSFYNIPSRIHVPMANTLFHTGRPFESVKTRWEAKDGTFVEVKERRAYISALYLHDNTNFQAPLFSFIPARPITPFREVKAGVGNIVRTLDFGDGNVGPASQELETAVNSISESRGGVTVDVWALIVPPDVFNSEKENLPEPGPEYVGLWMDKGARICRVVSGGGGWGPKQGLLSLDQDTELKWETKSDLQDEEIFSLGNVAETGAFIQFLVIDDNPPVPPPSTTTGQPILHRKSMVFGTIPSTIDDIPQMNSHESEKAQYDHRLGHFGCVSGSGIYYKHSTGGSRMPVASSELALENTEEAKSLDNGGAENVLNPQAPMGSTKITLPYSYLYFDSQVAQSETNITKGLSKTRGIDKESKKASKSKSVKIVKHRGPKLPAVQKDPSHEPQNGKKDKASQTFSGLGSKDDKNMEMLKLRLAMSQTPVEKEPTSQKLHEGENGQPELDFGEEDILRPTGMFATTAAEEVSDQGYQATRTKGVEDPNFRIKNVPASPTLAKEEGKELKKELEKLYRDGPRAKAAAKHFLNHLPGESKGASENEESNEGPKIQKHWSNTPANMPVLPWILESEARGRKRAAMYTSSKEGSTEPAFAIRKHNVAPDPLFPNPTYTPLVEHKDTDVEFKIRKHWASTVVEGEIPAESFPLKDMPAREKLIEERARYLAKIEKGEPTGRKRRKAFKRVDLGTEAQEEKDSKL